MQIQIIAIPDASLIATATRHGLRRPVLLARLAGWAILLFTVLMQVVTGDLDPVLLTGGAVLAAVVPTVLINHTARSLRSGQLTTYEIGVDGIASSDAESRHAYAWRAVRSVEELSGQLLFRLHGARLLPVPTAGLTSDQVEDVLGTASANGLRVYRNP